jgi:hypothetical protein
MQPTIEIVTLPRIIYAYDDGSYFSHLLEPGRDYSDDEPPALGALVIMDQTNPDRDHYLYPYIATFEQSDIGRQVGAICGPVVGVRIVAVEYPILNAIERNVHER